MGLKSWFCKIIKIKGFHRLTAYKNITDSKFSAAEIFKCYSGVVISQVANFFLRWVNLNEKPCLKSWQHCLLLANNPVGAHISGPSDYELARIPPPHLLYTVQCTV
jgi:hypothetical protein